LKIPYVIWLQDITSIAARILLRKRLFLLGDLIGQYYLFIEKMLLRKCSHIISITEDFLPILNNWGIKEKRISVIPNWAPVELLPIKPKRNPWALARGLDNKFCFLYSGTLGMKHNPQILLNLAKCHKDDKNIRVVVVTEGLGAKWLENQKEMLLWCSPMK